MTDSRSSTDRQPQGADAATPADAATREPIRTAERDEGARTEDAEGERAPERDHRTGGGHPTPETPDVDTPPLVDDPSPVTNRGVDRGFIIGQGFRVLAQWALRFILIFIALVILFWLLARVWVGVFPVMLALIVCTVLWPPVGWLRAKGWPPALAVATVLITAIAAFVGVFVAMAPSIVNQGQQLGEQAIEGVEQIQEWLAGPPLNFDDTQLTNAIDQAVNWAQDQAASIASGVFAGLSVAASLTITILVTLVLTFFFLKDGPRFLPWVRSAAGRNAGRHLTEVLTRMWRTLGGFIRVQAVVSFVDAFFIGLFLWIFSVPLWFVLAVLTFFGGFIPIVGAFTAGTLAVLVALVAHGWQTALWILLVIIAVQQLEGNLLQPVLQGRSMELHAGVILLAVTAGGTLFGIPGAFLAVPVAATVVVGLRYLSEQTDLRAGDLSADEVPVATPEGALVAASAERAARRHRDQARTHHHVSSAAPSATGVVTSGDGESDERAKPLLIAWRDRFRRRTNPDA